MIRFKNRDMEIQLSKLNEILDNKEVDKRTYKGSYKDEIL
jgi:hypothetical protein